MEANNFFRPIKLQCQSQNLFKDGVNQDPGRRTANTISASSNSTCSDSIYSSPAQQPYDPSQLLSPAAQLYDGAPSPSPSPPPPPPIDEAQKIIFDLQESQSKNINYNLDQLLTIKPIGYINYVNDILDIVIKAASSTSDQAVHCSVAKVIKVYNTILSSIQFRDEISIDQQLSLLENTDLLEILMSFKYISFKSDFELTQYKMELKFYLELEALGDNKGDAQHNKEIIEKFLTDIFILHINELSKPVPTINMINKSFLGLQQFYDKELSRLDMKHGFEGRLNYLESQQMKSNLFGAYKQELRELNQIKLRILRSSFDSAIQSNCSQQMIFKYEPKLEQLKTLKKDFKTITSIVRQSQTPQINWASVIGGSGDYSK